VTSKIIRCNKETPTPYISRFLPSLNVPRNGLVLDLGCGNLRNTNFAISLGFSNIRSFDRAGDFGEKLDLSNNNIPVEDHSVSLVLCNYLLCFFTNKQRRHLASEINRVAKGGTYLIVELYPAKDGISYNTLEVRSLFSEWTTKHASKDRFILKR